LEEIIQAIIIGVVQGLTEFLPVSSSAHLILLPRILGWDDALINSAEFVVMLHMGTLAALLLYFWHDVLDLLAAFWALLRERSFGDDPNRKLSLILLLTIIPAGLFGVVFEDWIDSFFRDALIVIPLILRGRATCSRPTTAMPHSSASPRPWRYSRVSVVRASPSRPGSFAAWNVRQRHVSLS